jgi:hypothetical protein
MSHPDFMPWLSIEIAQSLIDELDSRFLSHEVWMLLAFFIHSIGCKKVQKTFSLIILHS